MKIIQVYNAYQQKSGEDTVVEEEKKLLESKGHQVIQYLKSNAEIDNYNPMQKIKFALSVRGSSLVANEFNELLKKEKPDICHVHNVFSLITPSIYQKCKDNNIPVVQTLHNYRLLCTNTVFFRDGQVCEYCLGKSVYNSVKYKCFRDSYLMTAIMADAIQYHRDNLTWTDKIDAFICLSEFARQKFLSGGLPVDRLFVKPNFVEVEEKQDIEYDNFFLSVGRLEPSKGLYDFIALAKQCPDVNFVAIGFCESPELFEGLNNISFLGERPKNEVMHYMRKCRALIFLSKMYEGMPMVIIEAFSQKKSVIARDLGVMSSMLVHNENGLKFNGMEQLVESTTQLNSDVNNAVSLGQNAYQHYVRLYSPQENYQQLIKIYQAAIKNNAARL